MSDLISRAAAIDAVMRNACNTQRIYEAIKGLPSERPETHDKRTETHACDCISKTAAIDIVEFECGEWRGLAKTIAEGIEQLPSAQPKSYREGYQAGVKDAQPERKTGKWEIYVISMFDGEGCRCSECGLEGVPYWDFCPNCGANMREG